MTVYVPRRQRLSVGELDGAPGWATRLNDVQAANSEEVARAVDVAREAGIQTTTVSASEPTPEQPLVLAQAKGCTALWVGGCVAADGTSVATSLRWRPGSKGAVVEGLGLSDTAKVTFCWVR